MRAYNDRCSCLKFRISHSIQRAEKCFIKGKAYTIFLFVMYRQGRESCSFTLIAGLIISYSGDGSIISLGYGQAQHCPVQSCGTNWWHKKPPICYPQVDSFPHTLLPCIWFLFSSSKTTSDYSPPILYHRSFFSNVRHSTWLVLHWKKFRVMSDRRSGAGGPSLSNKKQKAANLSSLGKGLSQQDRSFWTKYIWNHLVHSVIFVL